MRCLSALLLPLLLLAPVAAGSDPGVPDEARLRAMTARFAPVDIGADVSALPASERLALVRMIEAARLLDGIYLRQVWGGNESLLLELQGDRSPLGQTRLHAFLVNRGPWSQLDEQAPFLPGVPPRPEGANFYPAGATRAGVEKWISLLPAAEREAATGFFTTIRRTPAGAFTSVPYSVEYQGELARAAELLREAAAATTQPTLKAFLDKRAAAFVSNDYYASDVAWMELDASIEEAKADIAGLWALQQLVDKGVLDRSLARTMYTTFLASAFRSIRFGIDEAHGRGQVLQLNHLQDAGAIRVAPDGTFAVVPAKIPAAVAALTGELMTLQAEGSYPKAKALLDRLAVIRPETRRVLDRLQGVPVDIEPRFVTAEQLAKR